MKHIQSFLDYIRYELNFSVHTVSSYGNDLSQFAAFLTSKSDQFDPQSVTQSDVRAWLYDLSANRHLSLRTVRRKVQSVRAFFRFLKKRGVVDQSPATDIPLAKVPQRLPVFVREKEMDAVLDDDFDRTDFPSVRNRLIVTMLYETGMRRAELVSLKDADVDTERCELKVHGKRNKDRIIPFCRELADLIEIYRPLRSRFARDGVGALLLTDKGKPLYDKLVYNVVHSSLSAVTSGKRSPHVLRHSYASAMLNHGAGINSVKELLGHESLATTQIYTHITYRELKKNYKHAHPRALKKGG